ncbi:MAG: gluconate 2-dehydrogenase subunit 3 family protein [Bryobacteraceae bacterium]
MSNLIQIDDVSRRDLIRGIALALTSAGVLDLEAAQHVHQEAAAAKKAGVYTPRELVAHEFKTVERLAELIVPADSVSGSAKDAGAAEFIDLLCSQNPKLAEIYHGGIAWFDREMDRRYGKKFLEAAAAQQTELLDVLVAAEKEDRARKDEELVYRRSSDYRQFSAYTVKRESELGAGVKFFDWVRKMSVDAFYTSPLGIKDLDYRGNKGMSKYEVPKAAIEHALARSPFKA